MYVPVEKKNLSFLQYYKMNDMSKQKQIAAIDCNEAVKRFNDYMDNFLKQKERKELMHHIASCRQCFDKLEFEQLLKSKISSLGNSSEQDKKAARKQLEKILSKI